MFRLGWLIRGWGVRERAGLAATAAVAGVPHGVQTIYKLKCREKAIYEYLWQPFYASRWE